MQQQEHQDRNHLPFDLSISDPKPFCNSSQSFARQKTRVHFAEHLDFALV